MDNRYSWSHFPRTNYIHPLSARWQLVSAFNQADAFPINEECDCNDSQRMERGGCCYCNSPCDSSLLASSTLDEIDGIEDILAVSHVQEKPPGTNPKAKPPLVRAKTLPAIITPGLAIIQTQMDCDNESKKASDGNVVTPSSHKRSVKNEEQSKKSKGSPVKVTFLVNHGGSSWKSSNSIAPSSVPCVISSPRISPAHSSSSQVTVGGSEKSRCEHQANHPNSWMGFVKLARFLNQREKEKAVVVAKQYHCRRTHSLESDDLAIRKANSIDSLIVESNVEATSPCAGKETKSIPPSPSVPARLERPCPDVNQSSPSLHTKLIKSRTGWSRESVEYLVDSLQITKSDKKKLDKFNKINIHMHALFLAAEHHQLEKAHSILENVEVDVNSVNNDGFNVLDIAVFCQDVPLSKLLLSYGAKENTRFQDQDFGTDFFNNLVHEAEQKVESLTTSVLNTPANSNVSAIQFKESEKQLMLWERRYHLLKNMKLGFEQMRPPDPPSAVTLHVVGANQMKMDIEEPDFQAGAIVTKYKVEWSFYENFEILAGTEEMYDLRSSFYTIDGLQQGIRYYVRVSAGNIKGYSDPRCSCPMSAVPSIWRDVTGRQPRSAGRLNTMEDLFNQIRNSRPEYASEIKGIAYQVDTPAQQRKNQMKKSIKHLFTPAPKFHKHLKRGVFMATILYNEDRVLVTAEEYLPIVEVDETYPSFLHTDFHWMMKVACTWDDVKSLRQDMDKSLSSSTVHFRSRLLQAAAQMQSALGVQDLGQFFYKPLKDSNGTIVISTVCYIKDIKIISTLSLKWIPISKLQRKVVLSGAALNAGELLLASVSEQIQYNQMSNTKLPGGLYLGYLKVKSSMDLIRVFVPERTPNVLPHSKIRDNQHVSGEEWEWLTSLIQERTPRCFNDPNSDEFESVDEGDAGCRISSDERCLTNRRATRLSCPTEAQLHFGRQLLLAAKHLFSMLKVSKEEALHHRIHDIEIIELSSDISFILVLPSMENVCSVPGHSDEFSSQHGLVALPVQIFEMIHMNTYQRDFINRYSRLSSILEMDTIMAQHAHREAFSASEVTSAKQRLSQLHEFQGQVDNTWKGMRWIMDVLTYARDRQVSGGIPLHLLYDRFEVWSPATYSVRYERDRSCGLGMIPTSIGSGRSIDSFRLSSYHSCGRLPTQKDKGCSSRVSAVLSPPSEKKHWNRRIVQRKSSNIPKSFSDSFSSLGIVDIKVTVTDNADAMNSDDLMRLTPNLRSSSSGEIPLEDSSFNLAVSNKVYLKTADWNTPTYCAPDEFVKPSCSGRDDVNNDGEEEDHVIVRHQKGNTVSTSVSEPGILRVHAAYETGLDGGASIRLHVTPQTTAREVIDLVVKQLNMTAIIKEKENVVYTQEHLQQFCLVAVIGARERCLRDDFCPLKLQNPWTSGRLYVRLKNDVLAAIQHQPSLPDSNDGDETVLEVPQPTSI